MHRDSKTAPEVASANLADSASREITSPPHHRLLSRQEVEMLLHLTTDQVQFLINTGRITRIRIAGEERFDPRNF